MKTKTIEINNKTFELMKGIVAKTDYRGRSFMDIYDIYARPSIYKIRAFEERETFLYKLGRVESLILSGNTCTFSIRSIVKANNKEYHFYITRDHNRVNVLETV